MTEDPYGRSAWDRHGDAAPPWSSPPSSGSPGYGTAGTAAHAPWLSDHAQSSADDLTQTLHYPPGAGPPGSGPPSGGLALRESGAAPPPPPPRRSTGLTLGVIGAVVALTAVAVSAAFLVVPRFLRPSESAPTAQSAPTVPAPVPLTLTAAADCVLPPSNDAAGTSFSYGPEMMVDGQAESAWRCAGDGVGQTVSITFDRPARVQEIGIVGGYNKIDPTDGRDRFTQNRRIAAVRYTFDDGTTVTQSLRTGTGDRSLQTIPVPGVTSSGLTVTILRSVPGTDVSGAPAFDRVAISELRVLADG